VSSFVRRYCPPDRENRSYDEPALDAPNKRRTDDDTPGNY
jgi:hypothetical protein